jgi:CRISPR-associated protein (TIGR03984 family)
MTVQTFQIRDDHPAVFEPLDTTGLADLRTWLNQQAARLGLKWLLAHADDGVIWGRFEGTKLVTSHEAAADHAGARESCPPLEGETLREARVFSEKAELFLWRGVDRQWCGRVIRDAREGEEPTWEEAYDEAQMLWGTTSQPLDQDFTLMVHGSQGQRHALPMRIMSRDGRPVLPRLVVRHYLGPDDIATIVASRLVKLQI